MHPIRIRATKMAHAARLHTDPVQYLVDLLSIRLKNGSAHDIAPVLLALEDVGGKGPSLPVGCPPVWVQAQILADNCKTYDGPVEACTPKDMQSRWPDESHMPSNEARRQNAEYRKKHGLSYVGPRHVGKKPKQTRGRFHDELGY